MKATATKKAFNDEFEANLSQTRTYKKAYELAEKSHEMEFGSRKYSDYESFRITRYRSLKGNNVNIKSKKINSNL